VSDEPVFLVTCKACGGEGCYYEAESRFSRWHLDPPSEVAIPCDECHGRGEFLSDEPDAVDLDDLSERCGDFA
jgi:DnaJ-class molecular chaperone